MNWRIAEHPEGGTIIKHLDTPRFTARWTTGEFPLDQVRDGALFWTDEGSGAEDAIHVHGFTWGDPAPAGAAFERLMRAAVAAIEAAIMGRL